VFQITCHAYWPHPLVLHRGVYEKKVGKAMCHVHWPHPLVLQKGSMREKSGKRNVPRVLATLFCLVHMSKVGQNLIYIYGVNTVFLAGKSPNTRLYKEYINGSGLPYTMHNHNNAHARIEHEHEHAQIQHAMHNHNIHAPCMLGKKQEVHARLTC
jgi:hypothetical protein